MEENPYVKHHFLNHQASLLILTKHERSIRRRRWNALPIYHPLSLSLSLFPVVKHILTASCFFAVITSSDRVHTVFRSANLSRSFALECCPIIARAIIARSHQPRLKKNHYERRKGVGYVSKERISHIIEGSDVRRKKAFNIRGGKDDLSNGLAYSGGEATFYVWIILAFAYEGRYYSFMDRENKWEFSAFYSDITKHNGECT